MAPSPRTTSLTIGDLAERTGVPPRDAAQLGVALRLPAARSGWPEATAGTPSSDVAAVLEVLRHRDAGLALEAAVRRATTESLQSRSVYAELRRRHPELTPQLLSKTSLAGAQPRHRGRVLRAGGGAAALRRLPARDLPPRVLRPLGGARPHRPDGRASSPTSPLRATPRPACRSRSALPRDGARSTASGSSCATRPTCRRAWRPSSDPARRAWPDSRRRFEAVWTVDPRAVRHASRVAAALADEYRPGWRATELAMLDDEPPAASADLRRASDLFNRMMGYLDAGSLSGCTPPW